MLKWEVGESLVVCGRSVGALEWERRRTYELEEEWWCAERKREKSETRTASTLATSMTALVVSEGQLFLFAMAAYKHLCIVPYEGEHHRLLTSVSEERRAVDFSSFSSSSCPRRVSSRALLQPSNEAVHE